MEINKQYLAGLVDGEGYLGINFPSKNKNTIRAVVELGLGRKRINFILLNQIAKQYDGYFSINRKCPRIKFCGKKAINLLKKIIPYLIIKKENALIIMKIERIKSNQSNLHQNKKKINPLIKKIRLNNTKFGNTTYNPKLVRWIK